MDEINVLDNNSVSASLRQISQTATKAYIRVRLVILKQVYRKSRSAETRSKQRFIHPRLQLFALPEEHPRLSTPDPKVSRHW